MLGLHLDELVELPRENLQDVDAHPLKRILGVRHGRTPGDDEEHGNDRSHHTDDKALH